MTTTDCIKYESNTVSNGLNTIFATSAGKTALYEGVPIFSEPVLPSSLFIEPNKKAIDKKHEKNIAKKAEAERKKNATKAKLERKKRKRKEEQIDTIAKAIIKAQCSDDGCDCEG